MSDPTWFYVCNLGRTGHASTVHDAMTVIRRSIGSKRAVLGLIEIDEGDKTRPSDHALIRTVFTPLRGWRKTWMGKREPILSHRIKPHRHLGESVGACVGLAGETPARSWQVSVYPTPDGLVAVVNGHPPAGAHNGERTAVARRELLDRYSAVEVAERHLVAELLKIPDIAGVVTVADRNRRDYEPIHGPHEVIVAHHGPDYITAIPAVGHRVRHGRAVSVAQPVEKLHRLLGVPIWFPKA